MPRKANIEKLQTESRKRYFPEESPFKKKMREDRDDVPLRVLKKRTDYSERSKDFYTKRAPAVYSNTSPYGIAAQMLKEQLEEENEMRLARKRKL